MGKESGWTGAKRPSRPGPPAPFEKPKIHDFLQEHVLAHEIRQIIVITASRKKSQLSWKVGWGCRRRNLGRAQGM